ncbi:putative RING3 protein [Paratrimastix pyriformis]|uniref:RING3 protein n=1 Tax=Paratrimastix pyriformis TaxID=342808 RepID=A0ABQ8UEW8_9EUKA|nr:putative RING3 protein [Paratrimastix pyriformis]
MKRSRRGESPTTTRATPPRKGGKRDKDIPDELYEPLRSALRAIRATMKTKNAWPFNEPVDPVKLNIPDYFTIVKRPMDFSTIERKILQRQYASIAEVKADVKLVWDNCHLYNKAGTDVCVMAREIEKVAERNLAKIPQGIMDLVIPRPSRASAKKAAAAMSGEAQSELEETSSSGEEQVESMVNQKVREILAKPGTLPMVPAKEPKRRVESEKKQLSTNINKLPESRLGKVLDIIKAHMPPSSTDDGDEFEVDIDSLDAPTLHQLARYVNQCIARKKKARPGSIPTNIPSSLPIQPSSHPSSGGGGGPKKRPLTAQERLAQVAATQADNQQKIQGMEAALHQMGTPTGAAAKFRQGGPPVAPTPPGHGGPGAGGEASSSSDSSDSDSDSASDSNQQRTTVQNPPQAPTGVPPYPQQRPPVPGTPVGGMYPMAPAAMAVLPGQSPMQAPLQPMAMLPMGGMSPMGLPVMAAPPNWAPHPMMSPLPPQLAPMTRPMTPMTSIPASYHSTAKLAPMTRPMTSITGVSSSRSPEKPS